MQGTAIFDIFNYRRDLHTPLAIMIYRVSSMYNHKRQVIVLLVGAIILEMIIVVAIQSASASRKMRAYEVFQRLSSHNSLHPQPFQRQHRMYTFALKMPGRAGCSLYGYPSHYSSASCSVFLFLLLWYTTEQWKLWQNSKENTRHQK